MVKISWSRGWTSLLPPAGSGAAGGSLPVPGGKLRCIECISTQMNVFNYTMQNAATPPKRRSILLSTTEGGKGHLPTGGLSASLPVRVAHPRALASSLVWQPQDEGRWGRGLLTMFSPQLACAMVGAQGQWLPNPWLCGVPPVIHASPCPQ